MNRPLWVAGLAAAIAPVCVALAHAETPAAPPATAGDGRVVYTPDAFTQYAPQSALDMVTRVPGFSIDGGDNRRGFSGTGGNVLIDGERPSSKSQSVFDVLSRIPANQVERIEILSGALSAEAAGQAQVVNVVRRKTEQAGISGLYELELVQAGSEAILPRGSASINGKLGEAALNLGYSRFAENTPTDGTRRVSDPAGALIARRTDLFSRDIAIDTLTGGLETPLFGGKFALNAEAAREKFDTRQLVTTTAPFQDSSILRFINRERRSELGGDWETALGGGTLKLIALVRTERDDDFENTIVRDASGAQLENRVSEGSSDLREQIARASFGYQFSPDWTAEAGVESAFNRLDARLRFTIDRGLGPVAVLLPSANVRVEEERIEPFVRSGFNLGDWKTDLSLAWERSTISQSGDAAASRTLTYWKPSIQFSRPLGEGLQGRVRLFRDVGQLDFGDFAAASSQGDERVAAGNPGIVPQTSWRLESNIDWRWGKNGAISATVYRTWVQDVSDSIALGGFDAPGNIGDGDIYGVSFDATVPLDVVLEGLRFEAEGGLRETRVTDPLTRKDRNFSATPDANFSLRLRYEVPASPFTYGAKWEGQTEYESFRVNEVDVFERLPFFTIFADANLPFGKASAYIFNINDATTRRERRFFGPDRNGALVRTDLRKRQLGPTYGISFSGKF